MTRRSLLGLILASAVMPRVEAEADKPIPAVNSKELTPDTVSWFESLLVNQRNAVDDSDWSEIIARFGTVLLSHPLSPEARARTIARANSHSTDKILFIGDLSPGKRAMCCIIVRLDDKLKI